MYILNYSWAVWLAWLLGAAFVAAGLVNFAGIKPVREGFARWGFPRGFHFFAGAYDIVTGLAIAWYPSRPLGLLLSLMLCVVIWVTLIRHGEANHLAPSVILFGLTLLAAWGLRLIPL